MLATVAQARIENAWLRLSACAIVAALAAVMTNGIWPLIWLAGLTLVLGVERHVHGRLRRACAARRPPRTLWPLALWTALQSAYANIVAAMLWFAPHNIGDVLGAIVLCGSLANAAATVRASSLLSVAALTPTLIYMFALPLADFLWRGTQDWLELMPLVAGLLVFGWGVKLWQSLTASDAFRAAAEAAAAREHEAAAAARAAACAALKRVRDEVRTPLSALIGATEHLRRMAANPQARAHIAALQQAQDVLVRVLEDLADPAAADAEALRLEPHPADPRELARGVVAAFRVAAADKNLELFLDIAPATPALVEMDAARVRQILFNLVANAVRYTTHGGVRVKLAAQPGAAAGEVRLSYVVADTGQGMSRSQVALTFAPDAVPPAGAGNGLAIAQRLAKRIGARLRAKSEWGQGTLVSLTFDALLADADQAQKTEQSPRNVA